MKYLKIQNLGLLNPEFFQLMGISTKSNDPTKIGEHGTGLKYAVCFFLRNNVNIKLFIGNKEIIVEKRVSNIKNVGEVEIVYINNKRTSLSLNYGKQWTAWEAIREIYCNATDEKLTELEEVEELVGKSKHTTFYIEITEDVQKVITNWKHYFIDEEPLYSDSIVRIYPALEDHKLRIYKQGVLVEESAHYKSNFRFDFLTCPLNELRQYRGSIYRDIPSAIFNSNEIVIKEFLEGYNSGAHTNFYENYDDWEYATLKEESKKLWNNYLYLHPESAAERADKQYKVPVGLFKKFVEWGFSVESVVNSKNYYGGGSYSSNLPVRLISNPNFEGFIQACININMLDEDDVFEFKLGVPFSGDDWDFTTYKEDSIIKYVFNAELKHKDKKEIATVIEIALMVHRGQNIYNQLKLNLLNSKEYETNTSGIQS